MSEKEIKAAKKRTKAAKKRSKEADKRRKLANQKLNKSLEKAAKPHDKLAKDLEDIERKYIDKEIKQAPTDKELKEARKKNPKAKKFTLSEGPKDATKEGLKYKKAVLKSKTPEAFPRKPKTPTKRKIKTDLAKRNVGKAAKKVLKASANPYLLFLETALSPSPLNEGEEEAVRKMNEEYSRRTGILRNSGGTVKNYAKGGGVRKAKFMDN